MFLKIPVELAEPASETKPWMEAAMPRHSGDDEGAQELEGRARPASSWEDPAPTSPTAAAPGHRDKGLVPAGRAGPV